MQAEQSIGVDEADGRWRPDLDPGALPPTPTMTLGQRRLMRASLVHFAERGYGGSAVRDIAATLGMQAASVYKHFASKEAILEALVLLGLQYHHDVVVDAALAAGTTPAEQLQAFVTAHVMLHCEYPRLSDVVHQEWTHLPPETYDSLHRQSARAQAILSGILERGRDAGQFGLLDVQLTAVAVTGLGVAAAQWFPYQSERTAEEVVAHFSLAALDLCRYRNEAT